SLIDANKRELAGVLWLDDTSLKLTAKSNFLSKQNKIENSFRIALALPLPQHLTCIRISELINEALK
ncbi:MAG: hypothetical protein MHPSP_002950, partial [Paramarteilia canceri]